MEFFIHSLSRDFLRANVQEFISIARRNIADEYWNEDNFLSDLAGKWELSFYVTNTDSNVVGFLIASQKEQSVHIHKLVVESGAQRKGLASSLLKKLWQNVTMPVTLKVRKDNSQAIRFYTRNEFQSQEEQGDSYLMIHL